MTLIAGPHNTKVYQAMVIKQACSMMTVGIRPSKAYTKRAVLRTANSITGAKDKTYLAAIASLEAWIASHPMRNDERNEVLA